MVDGRTVVENEPRSGDQTSVGQLRRFSRLGRFGVVSGLGLFIDFCISVAMRESGLAPFWANVCGAACAVTFVFFSSVRHVFDADGGSKGRKYVAYLIWQAIAVPAASLAIAHLMPAASSIVLCLLDVLPSAAADAIKSKPGAAFVLAKGAFTPITFYANFVFMGWLLSGKLRWR